MKAYTLADWQTGEDPNGAIARYQEYLKGICSRLPGDVQKLAGAGFDISLNDGTITRLAVSLSDARVDIHMDGKWIADNTVGLRTFHLAYSGVTHFASTIDPEPNGPDEVGYDGYGDHGADEFELLGENLYEHRMLFWSGIILSIRFSGFTLAYEDIPNGKTHG